MNQELKISHSEEIKDLVSSLAKAQGTMKPAVFNRINPHFKTRYADFTSCMDACRSPLSDNGIAIIQYCSTIDGKLSLVTMLAHTSGQWMKSEFPLIASKMDSQGIGSAMTYAKRYSLCGMVGIVADEEGDDDGENAVGRGKQECGKAPSPRLLPPTINSSQIEVIKVLESQLDEECRDKLNKWLKSTYKVERPEDILAENFVKIKVAYENGVKFIQQNKAELANV